MASMAIGSLVLVTVIPVCGIIAEILKMREVRKNADL